MTQTSGLWTTSGSPSGHQVANYTQALWSKALRIIGGGSYFEGVIPNYLNELAGSVPAANKARIATGYALVDGKWYENDANVDVDIPSAVGGGNTRIDRIVLRASWSAFTVTITRIAGTDASIPIPPAITQTPGTTYDIMLYQALVNTSGTVTLTDERVWAVLDVDESTIENNVGELRVKDLGITTAKINDLAVTTGKINDLAVTTGKINDLAVTTGKINSDAITNAKIADDQIDSEHYVDGSIDTAHLSNDCVDDTKVGNRVPQFYRREGGNASDWSIAGVTTYTPTSVRMQAGCRVVVSTGGTTITFPTPFSDKPLVYLTCNTDNFYANITAIGATTVIIKVYNAAGVEQSSGDVNWFAVGPE